MIQPWGVLRFHGQLSTLEACIERAGASLARVSSSTGSCEPADIRARYEACLDPEYIYQMRVVLCTTAASALILSILILM